MGVDDVIEEQYPRSQQSKRMSIIPGMATASRPIFRGLTAWVSIHE